MCARTTQNFIEITSVQYIPTIVTHGRPPQTHEVKSPRRTILVPIQKEVILPSVKFGLMNVHSLNNKYDFVADHIVENKLDIVCITETWLSPKMNSIPPVWLHGYKSIQRPRRSGKGGGVAVVVNKALNCC